MDCSWFSSSSIPMSSDEVAELLKHCGASSDENEIWPIKFLCRYLDVGSRDLHALELAIRFAHMPTELQRLLFRLYARHFREAHGLAVSNLSTYLQHVQLIALHVSCRHRLHLALASAESFGQPEAGLRHIFVVGQPSGYSSSQYDFDPDKGVLTVPAPDNYEGLALKGAAIYRFLGFSGASASVMKLDDDIRCVPSKFSVRPLVELTRTYNYIGRVNKAGQYGIHRWWHLGKCEDENLNKSPYSNIVDCDYANGPAYFLSPKALNILSKASVYLCRAYEIELSYEDVAVGKILRSFGVHPHHYDPIEAGILYSCEG